MALILLSVSDRQRNCCSAVQQYKPAGTGVVGLKIIFSDASRRRACLDGTVPLAQSPFFIWKAARCTGCVRAGFDHVCQGCLATFPLHQNPHNHNHAESHTCCLWHARPGWRQRLGTYSSVNASATLSALALFSVLARLLLFSPPQIPSYPRLIALSAS